MMHEFCVQCGHKNLFESVKPKFCAGCGQPFNVGGAIVSRANSSEEEVLEQSEQMPKLNKDKLSQGWSTQVDNSGFPTFGSIAGSDAPSVRHHRPKGFKGKDVVKSTMKEFGRVTKSREIGK